jgi:uncharacterized protein
MPYEAPPDLAGLSLLQIADAVAARRLPPVDQWDPPEEIDSLMRIDAAGRWFHNGGEITRPAMVRAFSSLLVRGEDGRHWLMTPQCRQSIIVEDAAFVAVDMAVRADSLAFRLNTDDLVLAGPDNPLRAAGDPDCPAVYLAVRHGCEARIDRSTWLQLAELALASDMIVTSRGARFSLVPA